jgi:hypothetical protein
MRGQSASCHLGLCGNPKALTAMGILSRTELATCFFELPTRYRVVDSDATFFGHPNMPTVLRVAVTKDTLAVDLSDGRSIAVLWNGFRGWSMATRRNEVIGD